MCSLRRSTPRWGRPRRGRRATWRRRRRRGRLGRGRRREGTCVASKSGLSAFCLEGGVAAEAAARAIKRGQELGGRGPRNTGVTSRLPIQVEVPRVWRRARTRRRLAHPSNTQGTPAPRTLHAGEQDAAHDDLVGHLQMERRTANAFSRIPIACALASGSGRDGGNCKCCRNVLRPQTTFELQLSRSTTAYGRTLTHTRRHLHPCRQPPRHPRAHQPRVQGQHTLRQLPA